MKGFMLTIEPGADAPSAARDLAVDDTAMIHKAIGGYLEAVPGFLSIVHDGDVRRCVVFCDEDGKRSHKPFNEFATVLWHHALQRNGERFGLMLPDGRLADVLVGTVAVVLGDDEFMRAL